MNLIRFSKFFLFNFDLLKEKTTNFRTIASLSQLSKIVLIENFNFLLVTIRYLQKHSFTSLFF